MKTFGLAAVMALMLAGSAHAGIDVSAIPVTHKQSDLPAGWNKNVAFMEIFVRSYQDSDGDGVGDFKGLTSRLDYLKSLGVTGIWLMPMMPSGDHDHGYAVADYRAVNPEYGTMADFETFVKEAHKRGIGVILDFVVNHSASTNPLFVDASSSKSSPYRDWYVFADQDPKWPGFQWGPWRKVKNGDGYYYGVFDDRMPDFNLKNPRVVQYLQDTMRFWMNKGVDGFRLDAVTMLIEDGPTAYFNNSKNPGIVAQLKATLDSYDNRYMICEVSEKPELYIDACGHAFAYGTQQVIIESAKKGVVSEAVVKQLQSPMRDAMPLALQSHDAYVGDRLINQFGVNGVDNYKVAAAISILASATPFSYYGEEIGMSNGGTYNDPGLRSPMSWDGKGPSAGFSTAKPYRDPAINFAAMNVAAEQGDKDSLLGWYTTLYNMRRAHPVLGSGDFRLLSKAGDPTLVFTRSRGDDKVLVAINLSDKAQVVTADGYAAVALPPKSATALAGTK
ncbi:alpha-amylase family glycosyl hydrolase [Asticcacaulis solisilvae]|uniref:alpha-amylase family glycosyl hydrolase n=1 Tax=Asticcacaulis solisilvae TaxID=1217274 RepID=UPI003FD88B62